MALARSHETDAQRARARLARLRVQAIAAAPPETAPRPHPRAAPSPLGGGRRVTATALPAWADNTPAVTYIEPLRLAVLGALAAMLLIVGFGITQRLAQSRSAHVAVSASAGHATTGVLSASPGPANVPLPSQGRGQGIGAAPAVMPPPAAATPSPQLTAIKQALDGADAAAAPDAAPTATAAASTAPLNASSAPAMAAPPQAAAAAGTGWGAPPGQQAATGNDAWTNAPDGFLDQQSATAGPVVGSAPQPGAAIVWPVMGPLTSCFCPYHPLGIDVGVPLNTPVRAMAAGRVVFAGGNACCSYGYYVDIDHGNGIMTRYGHLSYIPAIPAGTPVRPGDIIGMSGTTGYSTGPHLHFEVRLNGVPVNPLDVLP